MKCSYPDCNRNDQLHDTDLGDLCWEHFALALDICKQESETMEMERLCDEMGNKTTEIERR